ncbi:MAG: hypothetical protein WC621_01615 [Patescibacteria group bacterium]
MAKSTNSKTSLTPVILVLVGEKLSGKEMSARYLVKKYGFVSYRFSRILTDILQRLRLPVSRVNEVQLVGGLREHFGGGVLAKVIKAEIEQHGFRRVVIDGLRHPSEYEVLKKLPGFKLVYLTAPLELRYQRAVARGEKVGESNFTLSQFKLEENLPTEIFIRALAKKAKVKLVNNGSLADLYQQIDKKIINRI